MAEGSRTVAGTSWRRLGSKLVIVELATAMVLLVGAGLLGQSLYPCSMWSSPSIPTTWRR
jgi:hypothetical protein